VIGEEAAVGFGEAEETADAVVDLSLDNKGGIGAVIFEKWSSLKAVRTTMNKQRLWLDRQQVSMKTIHPKGGESKDDFTQYQPLVRWTCPFSRAHARPTITRDDHG